MSSAGNRDGKSRQVGDQTTVVTSGTTDDSAATEYEAAGTPPWQRATSTMRAADAGAQESVPGAHAYHPQEHDAPQYLGQHEQRPLVTGTAAGSMLGSDQSSQGRSTVNLDPAVGTQHAGPGAARSGTPTALRRPGRGPRRASLQVKRVDPWSVLKLALVLSIAMFFVWMVAVGVLYGALDGMGVWDKLNGTYNDIVSTGGDGGELISAGRVFGVAAIVGVINIILFTALATVGTFVYNVSADLAGGLEITLSERE